MIISGCFYFDVVDLRLLEEVQRRAEVEARKLVEEMKRQEEGW